MVVRLSSQQDGFASQLEIGKKGRKDKERGPQHEKKNISLEEAPVDKTPPKKKSLGGKPSKDPNFAKDVKNKSMIKKSLQKRDLTTGKKSRLCPNPIPELGNRRQ